MISNSPFSLKQSNYSFVHTCPRDEVIETNAKSRAKKVDPKPFNEEPGYQNALSCISVRDPIRSRIIENEQEQGNKTQWKSRKIFAIDKELFDVLTDEEELVSAYQDLIDHHITMRVALFFQQAIVCYDTPFHFEIAKTEGQFFSAPLLKVKSGKENESIPYQAAHSSTIPGLKACLRSDFKKAKKNPDYPVKYFTFLKESQVENYDNSTVGLPRFVNQIDTLIDGKAEQGNLRSKTIALINKVALAQLKPDEATKEFLKIMDVELIKAPSRSSSMTDGKTKVIQIYSKRIKEMQKLASKVLENQCQPFFDHLIGSNFSKDARKDSKTIREIVYQRKYEIIRESQFLESKIQQKLEKIFKVSKENDKQLCKLALVYSFKNNQDRKKVLEKLFCISLETLEQDKNLMNQVETFIAENTNKFTKFTKAFRKDVRKFRTMEKAFQALLLRDFRTTLRNLRQSDLADEIANVIDEKIENEEGKDEPDWVKIEQLQKMPTSAATVSRLENSRVHIIKNFATPDNQRRKVLNLDYAKIIAKALNIQVGHFFCSFFASKLK